MSAPGPVRPRERGGVRGAREPPDLGERRAGQARLERDVARDPRGGVAAGPAVGRQGAEGERDDVAPQARIGAQGMKGRPCWSRLTVPSALNPGGQPG